MDTVSRSARFRAPSAVQLVFSVVSQIHAIPTKHRGCLLGRYRQTTTGDQVMQVGLFPLAVTSFLFLSYIGMHVKKGRGPCSGPFPPPASLGLRRAFLWLVNLPPVWTWSEAGGGKQKSSVVCDRLRAAPGSRQLGTDDGDPSARDSGAASADPWFPVSNANTLRASDTTSTQQARLALLKKIFKPAAHLQKGSIEYERLARSERVWEDYFMPGNSLKMGYVDVQRKLTGLLSEIDHLRGRLPVTGPRENPVKDSIRNFESLRGGLEQVCLASTPSSELARLVTAWTAPRGAGVIESATHELQNHIIASQWVAKNAAAKAGIAGLCEVEVRVLAVVSVVNTDSESAYDTWRTDSKKAGGNLVWGSKVPLREYRNLPISVRSNRLRTFPYLQEVPACMERFFQYRDLQHREKALHPLILACQMTAYFVLVQPFPDGNGRTSRMVKQDYLARQGYSPVITRDLKREDYLRMIYGAGQGKPEEFVIAVLEAQVAVLHQASTRLKM
ncbi:fic/DOC family protein [Colletotrichum lupini]|uniref:Fic/DOC family protein n=1 Tax=Colletotrichum lupini TaxID=145971 RepID=A0A9Q8WCD9_9PEZI|nr:fic/DOC family protein [Colletotrichum lupini]UQC78578.1 fic/DOC family protein [Colletotrichum lupini]